jgi:hypothetical protein
MKNEMLQAEKTAILNQTLYVVRNMIIFDFTEKDVKTFGLFRFHRLVEHENEKERDGADQQNAKTLCIEKGHQRKQNNGARDGVQLLLECHILDGEKLKEKLVVQKNVGIVAPKWEDGLYGFFFFFQLVYWCIDFKVV